MGGTTRSFGCETAMKSCVLALAFVAEFIQDTTQGQHHKGADQACACCHHFRPAAECYSMRCGDHSGNYCWSGTDKGIHWGWGAGGRHWKAGATECNDYQKNGTCKAQCIKEKSCNLFGKP